MYFHFDSGGAAFLIIHMGQEADRPWGDFEELQAFTGVVDDMRVWTTARTDAEIMASYLGGLTGNTSLLDFNWMFNNVSAPPWRYAPTRLGGDPACARPRRRLTNRGTVTPTARPCFPRLFARASASRN